MTKSKLSPIAWTLVALSLLGVNANAQSSEGQPSEGPAAAPLVARAALNLTLSKTTIRTQNDLLSLSTTLATAFSPTAVACPSTHPKGCTIKVEVSSQFWAIGAGNVAQMNVGVSGGLTVDPNSLVNVDSTTTGGLASVRTFQWMIRNVPAGSTRTVRIQFQVNAGSANAGFRTASIGLYLN